MPIEPTASAALALPGTRALPGWWRDLAPHAPRRFWFAHLVLHKVEALVKVASPAPLEALARGVLMNVGGGAALDELAARLAIDRDMAATLAATLVRDGLAEPAPEGRVGPPTEAGRAALAGAAGVGREERRTFYFADTRPPVYLPLAPTAATALPPPSGWRFDLQALEACLARPAAWKESHGFPGDVTALVWPRAAVGEATWHAVPLDRPEQALLALAETAAGELVGLPVRPDTWALGREVALRQPFDADLMAALAGDVRLDEWHNAWRAWCQQRSLPAGDAEACKLEVVGHRLVVKAPPRLLERLRQARSEALRGEAWLIAGAGRARPAALVEIG